LTSRKHAHIKIRLSVRINVWANCYYSLRQRISFTADNNVKQVTMYLPFRCGVKSVETHPNLATNIMQK